MNIPLPIVFRVKKVAYFRQATRLSVPVGVRKNKSEEYRLFVYY